MQKILRSLIRLLLGAKETENKKPKFFDFIPIVWAKSVLFSQPICIWTPNFCMTFGISANQDLANHPVLISSSHLPGKSPTLSVDIIATVDRPTPMKQHFCHIPTIVTLPFTHLQGKEWAQPLAMNEWAVCPKKGPERTPKNQRTGPNRDDEEAARFCEKEGSMPKREKREKGKRVKRERWYRGVRS